MGSPASEVRRRAADAAAPADNGAPSPETRYPSPTDATPPRSCAADQQRPPDLRLTLVVMVMVLVVMMQKIGARRRPCGPRRLPRPLVAQATPQPAAELVTCPLRSPLRLHAKQDVEAALRAMAVRQAREMTCR